MNSATRTVNHLVPRINHVAYYDCHDGCRYGMSHYFDDEEYHTFPRTSEDSNFWYTPERTIAPFMNKTNLQKRKRNTATISYPVMAGNHNSFSSYHSPAGIGSKEDQYGTINSFNIHNNVPLTSAFTWYNRNNSNKRRKTVRFQPQKPLTDAGTPKGNLLKKTATTKDNNKEEFDSSLLWYTRNELEDVRKTFTRSLDKYVRKKKYVHGGYITTSTASDDDDDIVICSSSLDRYTPDHRRRRKLARKKMTRICQAIRKYEFATNTNVPEMLSSLLNRYSKQMAWEAIQRASSRRDFFDVTATTYY